ncbi:epsilon-sarcoglycan [Elysia marginata]|uniref:Epsilon-sarcoglycan n=1 Tax=Elysia marginata TaxID=1093978 RepID=A0AAV4FGQ4_9GAST|nr:epsilon-sarcoglycan [Elysia marginata]
MASEAEIQRIYDPPTECGDERCQDLFPEFLYCVVVPCSILVFLCLVIAVALCCRSKSCQCKKYSELNPQISSVELEDYNSIRRASITLRQMSRNRETPLLGSRANSMTLDRSLRRHPRNRDSCSSAPGTLQRQHRNRRAERPASAMALQLPYADDVDGSSVNGFSPHARSRHFYEDDVQSPPPPPPYRAQEEDAFTKAGFLQVSMHSSVTYEENSDTNGSGAQPLLGHHHSRAGQHSNMGYSSHSQW